MLVAKKVENLLLGLIFLLPLLRTTNDFGYEQTKVSFFIVCITIIGLFQIKKRIKWTLVTKVSGLFILILWGKI